MVEVATKHGVRVLSPESVNSQEAQTELAALKAELFVVCDYGEILASSTLQLARKGGINLHASLLPKYRGAAPIPWAIYHGELETGVTIIQMNTGLDAGPCIAQCRVAMDPEETAAVLEERLAVLGAGLVCQTVDAVAAGRVRPLVQDARQATKAPRLKKSDGLVDWSRTALQIKNQVRAMQPWPTAYTYWQHPDRDPLRFILHQVDVCGVPADTPGGTVVRTQPQLLIATAENCLEILRIQPEGKRVLAASELLRGYPVEVGHMLGADARHSPSR
jgi:methionyl-tRNA formyltransferase